MNIEINNISLQEEYDMFKKLVPNAREVVYSDGSRSLIVAKEGKEIFHLDYIKQGQLSERDVFVVKNWGHNPSNAQEIVEAYNCFVPEKINVSREITRHDNVQKPNINITNISLQEEYDKFKKLASKAREVVYTDGSRSLIVERDGMELFHLDYIKQGQLSERDVFVVKHWGTNPNNAEEIIKAYNTFVPEKIDISKKEVKENSVNELDLNKQEPPIKEDAKVNTLEQNTNELLKIEREKRKFTILQRERAMSEAQKGKNRSAFMAGACILGAAVAVYFNGQDPNQVIQHELNSIYSWESLGKYMQDLGPLTTLLSVATAGFISKYCKYSKKFQDIKHQFEDYNASLEKDNSQALGGIQK